MAFGSSISNAGLDIGEIRLPLHANEASTLSVAYAMDYPRRGLGWQAV